MTLEASVIKLTSEFTNKEILLRKRLVEDLGMDSLDLVEYVMALENEFDIEIDDSSFDTLRTVGDAVNLVNELKAN